MKKIILLYSVFSVLNLFSQNYTSKTAGQPTGNSQEVGITAGQLSVSLTGGATYQIPIAVAPGINGIAPQIALGYNSQGGNGVAGYGWNISGVSAITRISSTKFHDNFIDGVDFDSYDRFALDGQRLILKSGTYGTDGAVYETENFSTLKVVSYGTHPDGSNYGPQSFKVFYPDGTVSTFGGTLSSRTKNLWSINEWKNPQDLRIKYSYIKLFNSLLIQNINYGKKGGSSIGLNRIHFVYNTRNRSEQAYINGTSFKNTEILSEIKVISGSSGFRNYLLEHNTTSLGYERLTKITEKSGDNSKSYNPTLFTYDDTNNNDLFNPTTTNLGLTNTNALNTSYISGDFNGDAKMDVIAYPTTGSQAKKEYWLFTDIANGGSNDADIHNVGEFENIFPVSWLNHNSKLMSQQGWSVVKKIGNQYKFSIYSKGSTYPIYHQYDKTINDFPVYDPILSFCTGGGVFPKKMLSGDFNGDGLTDVIALDTSLDIRCSILWGGGWTNKVFSKKAYFIDLNRNKTSNFWNLAGELSENLPDLSTDYDIQVGDFNGDGKSDFFVIQEDKMIVYSLDNNNQLIILASITSDTDIDANKPHLLGDFNGDGKMDVVIPRAVNQDSWAFYFSNGIGFQKKISPIGVYYALPKILGSNGRQDFYYIPNDINSDGKTDIIYVNNRAYEPRQAGSHFTNFKLLENITVNPNTISFNKIFEALGDNGDIGVGKTPLPIFLNQNNLNQNLEFALMNGSKIHHFKHSKDHRQDVLLRQVTTGNGVVETINYKPLVQENNPDEIQLYNPTYNEIYPYMDVENVPSLQVVSKLEKESKDQYSKQIYAYYGAVSNVEGLGFLGFKSLYRSNWYNDDFNPISNVTKHDISKRGAVYESYSSYGLRYNFQNTPSDFMSKTLNNYTSNLSSRKVFKLTNNSSTSYNGLQNTSVSSTITYDGYNNPLTSTIVLKEGGTTQQTKITTLEYEHNPNGGSSLINPYYIGRVQNKNVQTSGNGDTFTTEEQYRYNSTMLLTQKKYKGHNTNFITDSYIYDAFGNIERKTVTAGGTFRINSYEYDNTGRFLTKDTDVEGLQTQYLYNTNGYLLEGTNPYGLVTQYQYDTWGKSIKETDYLGNQTNIIYSRSGIFTQFTINAPDGSKSYKKFDDLGREILVGSYGFAQKWDYVQTTYDIYDRKTSVSEPYNGSASQFNTSFYDVYGRLIQTETATGKTTNISYNGLSATAADGYKTITTVKNSLDQVTRMTDDGGTINYLYYANGNLKQSSFDGIVTSMQYDGWGRKIKLTDPSAGIYQYEYNAFGETTKEITPIGETTFVLDSNGKLTQKIVQGDYTNLQSNYNYDSATKLLKSINTNQNTTYIYLYDNYKRMNKTIESNANAVFERTFTFDGLGRTNTERYKARNLSDNKISDITTKNVYKNGSLYKILNNADQGELWKINTVNQRGQITNAAYGNGIIESNSYDDYGLPTRIHSEKDNTNLIDLNFDFNVQRGVLNSRSSNLYNHNETFQYDNLNRLVQYTNTQGQQKTQVYDGKGRITYNPVGSFAYANASKPYQNTSIDLSGTPLYDDGKDIQNITYNAFKSPVNISANTDRSTREDIYFEYNIFQQRSTVQFKKYTLEEIHYKTKLYAADGTTEITKNISNNQTEFMTYLGGDAYSAPIVYKSNGSSTEFLYLHRDYLGSIIAISNSQSMLIEKRHFDAWGKVTMIKDQNGNSLDQLTILERGYTGHEHLASVDLINMNARLYDANLHRFLAPDSFVQNAYDSQNLNRYSYANNNPLVYVDLDGNNPFLVALLVKGLIGAAIAVTTNGIINTINNQPFFQNAGIAAISGFVGGAMSSIIGNTAGQLSGFGKFAFQTFAHAHLGGVMNGLTGGDYLSGFVSGGTASIVAEGIGNRVTGIKNPYLKAGGITLSGAVTGGAASVAVGGNFWDGFRNGMISAGLNHADHLFVQSQQKKGGIIFTEYSTGGKKFDIEEFNKALKTALIKNGFSKNITVTRYSFWKSIKAALAGRLTAGVLVRGYYVVGAPIDRGVAGYAKKGSNSAIVYGGGKILGRTYDLNHNRLANTAAHELGHAIFSFGHTSSGLMYWKYGGGDLFGSVDPFILETSQLEIVKNSLWGQ